MWLYIHLIVYTYDCIYIWLCIHAWYYADLFVGFLHAFWRDHPSRTLRFLCDLDGWWDQVGLVALCTVKSLALQSDRRTACQDHWLFLLFLLKGLLWVVGCVWTSLFWKFVTVDTPNMECLIVGSMWTELVYKMVPSYCCKGAFVDLCNIFIVWFTVCRHSVCRSSNGMYRFIYYEKCTRASKASRAQSSW